MADLLDHSHLLHANELARQAAASDSSSDYPTALDLYTQALAALMTALETETMEEYRGEMLEQADTYMQRAEELKAIIRQQRSSSTTTADVVVAKSTTTPIEHVSKLTKRMSVSLFGTDAVQTTLDETVGNFHSRVYRPWVVTAEAGNRFRATVETSSSKTNNNQLMIGLFISHEHATAVCTQQSPVKWLDEALAENRKCQLCKSGFAILRRVHHCRNCGCCICSECSTTNWPSKMVPHTYHADHEKKVRVCDACHYIMENFRSALLEGDVDKAISFFSTGNVNLVSPYKIFEHNWFPLHAAAKGGNLTLFKFLVEQHKVPIYYYKQGVSLPYCTNDGKSVLAIAAQEKKWDIVRYLVVEKHVPMTQVTDCSVLQVLGDYLLKNEAKKEIEGDTGQAASAPPRDVPSIGPEWTRHLDVDTNLHYLYNEASGETMWEEETTARGSSVDDGGGKVAAEDEGSDDDCVVCFDRTINSVFVACGHVVCCYECGQECSACPICRQESGCVKTFSK